MKIVYLHHYFNTPEMAGGTRSYELARRLVSRGHEVHMITSWRGEDSAAEGWYETSEASIKVHWLSVPYSNRMSHGERIKAFLRFAWQASRKAASIRCDVVFATSTPLTIALPGIYAKLRQKVPMVFEIRDLWPDVPIAIGALQSRVVKRAAYALEKRAYKYSDRIVALTPTMKDFLCGKGVAPEKVHVIPNGCDLTDSPEQLTWIAPHSEGYTILYCGGLGPAHGPGYLVELADQLHRMRLAVKMVVLGDGKLRKSLESEARSRGCLDRTIRFEGEISKGEVWRFYRECDASIMTMADVELLYRHSVQNKFFDSLAAGRTVFSNYRGWASELSELHGAGEILPRDDISAAADLLWKRLSNSGWMRKASSSARGLARSHFDYDRLASSLEEVLQAALLDRSR